MEIKKLTSNKGNIIDGPLLIERKVFLDTRGFFFESWNQSTFDINTIEKIIFSQENVKPLGHSIECRINAESPKDFKPSAGSIKMYHPPAGNGIRLDTFIYSGYKVPHYYDNLQPTLLRQFSAQSQCGAP